MNVLPSCYDKDFTDISDSVQWHPSFSLPVGNTTFKVDNFFANLPSVSDVLDTLSSLPDSLSYLPDSLAGLPDSIAIKVLDSLGVANSLGLDSIYYNNQIRYLFQKKIPLNDNFDYSFSDIIEEYDNIDSLLFRIYVKNGFPTNTNIQIYMVDSANNIIDSLFATPSNKNFPPANIDDNEKVLEPSVGSVDVPFDSTRIKKLKLTKNVLFNVDIYATSDKIQKIKFYSYYEIYIKLGVRLTFHNDFPSSNNK